MISNGFEPAPENERSSPPLSHISAASPHVQTAKVVPARPFGNILVPVAPASFVAPAPPAAVAAPTAMTAADILTAPQPAEPQSTPEHSTLPSSGAPKPNDTSLVPEKHDSAPRASEPAPTLPAAPTESPNFKLAFEGRLRPVPGMTAPAQESSIGSAANMSAAGPPAESKPKSPAPVTRAAEEVAAPVRSTDSQAASSNQGDSHEATEHSPDRKTAAAAPATRATQPAEVHFAGRVEEAPVNTSAPDIASATNASPRQIPASEAPAAPPAAPPLDPAPANLAPPAATTPLATSGIKIAVNDAGQRVELRVVERAGDIHVTVRTPDAQLATSLRGDLPTLSTRLEENGLHADLWRPASAGNSAKTLETGAEKPASESGHTSGERQAGGNAQDNSRNRQQQTARKNDQKEFTWLFQSIR